MNHESLGERLEEIDVLVEESDLSRASRRLLDLFADFQFPNHLKQEAISLRAQYNRLAKVEDDTLRRQEKQTLLARIGRLLDTLEESTLGQFPEEKTISPKPTDLEAKAFYNQAGGSHSQKGTPVFSGLGISKSFRTDRYTFQLPKLDLELKLGQISGVVGENGNGKTTLLRIVAGELEADAGILHYPAFDVKAGDWYHIKQNIAFIPQQLPSWQGLLKENLHFTAAIHDIKGKENEERVDFIIHRLGLSQYEDALWSEVSSGYKLRFTLAKALVWRPRLLIIDEPLANLDINTQQMFLQDLRYLADSTQNPMAILLTSQHLHEVESIADHIIFIQKGQVLYNGAMKEFGQDRVENLFEISTETSKTELARALDALPGVTIEDQGKVKLIHTPTGITANEVLSSIVSHGISLQYFRDISTSTLKFFREQPRGN